MKISNKFLGVLLFVVVTNVGAIVVIKGWTRIIDMLVPFRWLAIAIEILIFAVAPILAFIHELKIAPIEE